mgnify:CR=1 FL=1
MFSIKGNRLNDGESMSGIRKIEKNGKSVTARGYPAKETIERKGIVETFLYDQKCCVRNNLEVRQNT